jgi:DNA-binding response OmpR family regulator
MVPKLVEPLAGRRILVVEDEYLIAMDVKDWLMAAGATVAGPVPSVDQALDLIKDEVLTAAVLDVNLGHGDTVYAVAAELGALGVPYLFATGDVRVSDANGYRDRPRLTKPYLEAELVRAMTELISGSPSEP